MVVDLAVLFAVVFAINLLPAFGPPTWSVIVLYGLNSNLPLVGIVATGALAAACGRFALAHGFRAFAGVLSQKTRRNLAAVRAAFERNQRGGIIALALFAVSPLSSAQLFAAAGLARVPLLAFTAAFFAGRIVSYSIYAGSAQALQHSSLGQAFRDNLSSPIGIVIQVVMLLALVVFARIDWERILGPAPENAGPKGEG